MNKVNLFIVGAMKAGTTSFVEMLSKHPDIYFSPVKEPHFFVNEMPVDLYSPSKYFSLENYLNKEFPNSLHIANIKTLEQYEKIFSLAPENVKYRAEASTYYLHAKESAKKIYEYNPNAKIVILLRDPLKRAYSHYKMDAGLGRVTKKFEDYISDNINDYYKGDLKSYSYLGMSLYKPSINRFIEVFGVENVQVINVDDFYSNKNNIVSQFFNFLYIKKIDVIVEKSNAAKEIRFKNLIYFINKTGIKELISKIIPKKITQMFFYKVLQKNNDKLELKEEIKVELNKIFIQNN